MMGSRKFFASEKQAKDGLTAAKTLVSCARSHAQPRVADASGESTFQRLRRAISVRNRRATMRLKAGNSRCYSPLIARRRRVCIDDAFIRIKPLLVTA